jgi:superfamily II DNA/RNA helicase
MIVSVNRLLQDHILPAARAGSRHQTLLFSATMPPKMKQVMGLALRDEYVTVDCIGSGVANDEDDTVCVVH